MSGGHSNSANAKPSKGFSRRAKGSTAKEGMAGVPKGYFSTIAAGTELLSFKGTYFHFISKQLGPLEDELPSLASYDFIELARRKILKEKLHEEGYTEVEDVILAWDGNQFDPDGVDDLLVPITGQDTMSNSWVGYAVGKNNKVLGKVAYTEESDYVTTTRATLRQATDDAIPAWPTNPTHTNLGPFFPLELNEHLLQLTKHINFNGVSLDEAEELTKQLAERAAVHAGVLRAGESPRATQVNRWSIVPAHIEKYDTQDPARDPVPCIRLDAEVWTDRDWKPARVGVATFVWNRNDDNTWRITYVPMKGTDGAGGRMMHDFTATE